MATIRVTPDTLRSEGNDLKQFAETLEETLNSIDSKINEIIDNWDGLAQDSYFASYTEMKDKLKACPELVQNLGTSTTSAADAFEQVDEQLASSFK